LHRSSSLSVSNCCRLSVIGSTNKQSPSIQYVEGFESVSDIGTVRAEMEKRGYTAEEIAKVFGGNWMRVYREAWNS